MTTTLIDLFKSTFHRDTILAWARETGAVLRLRLIHPQEVKPLFSCKSHAAT